MSVASAISERTFCGWRRYLEKALRTYLRKVTQPARSPTANRDASMRAAGVRFQLGWVDQSRPENASSKKGRSSTTAQPRSEATHRLTGSATFL